MNYYITNITKKVDGAVENASRSFTSRDAAYSYLYARMGGLLGREDTIGVAIELIDENCIQYERFVYEKSELIAALNEQKAKESTENPKGE